MNAKRDQQLGLRIEPDLRRAIAAAAEQERRPVASLVRCILDDWLQQRRLASRGDNGAATSLRERP